MVYADFYSVLTKITPQIRLVYCNSGKVFGGFGGDLRSRSPPNLPEQEAFLLALINLFSGSPVRLSGKFSLLALLNFFFGNPTPYSKPAFRKLL